MLSILLLTSLIFNKLHAMQPHHKSTTTASRSTAAKTIARSIISEEMSDQDTYYQSGRKRSMISDGNHTSNAKRVTEEQYGTLREYYLNVIPEKKDATDDKVQAAIEEFKRFGTEISENYCMLKFNQSISSTFDDDVNLKFMIHGNHFMLMFMEQNYAEKIICFGTNKNTAIFGRYKSMDFQCKQRWDGTVGRVHFLIIRISGKKFVLLNVAGRGYTFDNHHELRSKFAETFKEHGHYRQKIIDEMQERRLANRNQQVELLDFASNRLYSIILGASILEIELLPNDSDSCLKKNC